MFKFDFSIVSWTVLPAKRVMAKVDRFTLGR